MDQSLERALKHIAEVARIPSFSSYEERLHPYIKSIFDAIPGVIRVNVTGNNLIFKIPGKGRQTIALAAHLDKIDHYGSEVPDKLPVTVNSEFIEGAMDDSMGVGVLLTLAQYAKENDFPDLLFFFSEMEESKGLKDHPERLKNAGKGYESGMGAKQIARRCVERKCIPGQVITIDTTPLFKGEAGIALYANHWELNGLEPSAKLKKQTTEVVECFLDINNSIKVDNNTNDYLHYGKIFNQSQDYTVPSVALEPAIFPYHQKGERVFLEDIRKTLNILTAYLRSATSI